MTGNKFISKQIESLNKLMELQQTIRAISKSLEKLYPVAIVKDNVFYVFDFDKDSESYEFKCEFKAPMPISEQILAAFDLDFYANKMAAVIHEKALDTLEGYIFTFHEFVHCYQVEHGEQELRSTVKLAQKSRLEGNFMWEITYEFPYESEMFIILTSNFEAFSTNKDLENIHNYYKQLKTSLDEYSFEYMMWQQWKEGHARYIENLIRERLNFPRNSNVIEPPFSRVSFYEIGSRYIELLVQRDKSLLDNTKGLYYKMISLTN